MPTCLYRQNRENGKNKSLSGKTQGIFLILPKRRENTGNLVCSSCKFPDSKGKTISIFAAKIPKFLFKLDMSTKSVGYMQ